MDRDLTFPHELCFGILPEQIPHPALIIRHGGDVEELKNMRSASRCTVLVQGGKHDDFGTTRAQREAIQQLIRIALHYNRLCTITFMGGISPWSKQILPRAEFMAPLNEMMAEPYINYRKYLLRPRPRHPVIKEKRGL